MWMSSIFPSYNTPFTIPFSPCILNLVSTATATTTTTTTTTAMVTFTKIDFVCVMQLKNGVL
jgi:hypothetical protein